MAKLNKISDECRRLINSFEPFAKFKLVGSLDEQLVAFVPIADAASFSFCRSTCAVNYFFPQNEKCKQENKFC